VLFSPACGAKQWQDSGGIARVAAQRGGDVALAVLPEDADGSRPRPSRRAILRQPLLPATKPEHMFRTVRETNIA